MMNYIHLIMLKLIKGATSVAAVVCNHDFYAFLVSVETDVQSVIAINTDVQSIISATEDLRGLISLDPTDVQSIITINTDVLGEVC